MKTIAYIRKSDNEVEDRDKLISWFTKLIDKLPNGEHTVEINQSNKTDKQNKFYWVCVNLLAHEFGISPDSLHKHFKSEWLPSEEYFVLIRKKQKDSTSQLYKDEMSDYIEKVIRLASEQGIRLPDPEEYKHQIN